MIIIYIGEGIFLNPAIQFGRNDLYETRHPPHHVNTFRFKKSFGQKHFWCQTSAWWNILPLHLFQDDVVGCISCWPVCSRDCDLF